MIISHHLYEVYPYHSQYEAQTPTEAKYVEAARRFTKRYGSQPAFFVKVPARALLMGSKSAYYGGDKLYVCLEKDIIIGWKTSDKEIISVHNQMATLFPDFKLELDPAMNKYQEQLWFNNSLIAGMKAALSTTKSKPVDLYISWDFERRKGLNFKLALALASAIAFSALNQVKGSELLLRLQEQLHKLSARQANLDLEVYFLARNRKAVLKRFHQTLVIDWPENLTLLYFDSLRPRPLLVDLKAEQQSLWDGRIWLGMALVNDNLGYSEMQFKTVWGMMELMQMSVDEMLALVEESIHQHPYSLADLQHQLQKDLSKIIAPLPYSNLLMKEKNFQLYQPIRQLLLAIKWANQLANCETDLSSILPSLSIQEKPTILKSSVCKRVGWGQYILIERKEEVMRRMEQIVQGYYQVEQVYMDDEIERQLFRSEVSHGSALLNPQYEIWFG